MIDDAFTNITFNGDGNDDKNNNTIGNDTKQDFHIVLVYIFGIFLWIFVIVALRLYTYGMLVIGSAFIPIYVFSLNLYTVVASRQGPPPVQFSPDVYTSLIWLGIIFLTALGPKDGIKRSLLMIIAVGFFFNLISVLPVWVPAKSQYLYNHIVTVFVTLALTLVVVTLIVYSLFHFRETNVIAYKPGDVIQPPPIEVLDPSPHHHHSLRT